MDLHLTADQPTTIEKEAVDGELGATDVQRHRLLPVLHAIQARIGHITPGAVNYVAQRLDVAPAEIHGVASFYGMFSLTPRAPVVAHVCDDIACLARGAATLCAELEKTPMPSNAAWQRSPCLGLCERAPAALVVAAGETPRERVLAPANAAAVKSLISDASKGRLPAEPDVLNPAVSVPQAGQSQLRLLRRIGQVDASNLDDYRRLGGYEA